MNENVFVILSLDYHLPRIRRVIASIKKCHKKNLPDVAISNYGKPWTSVKPEHMRWHTRQKQIVFGSCLKKFCQSKNLYYYQPTSGTFDYALHILDTTDEALNLVHIARHFYQLDYSHVYLLHNDIRFNGNAIDVFEKYMRGKWSFIGVLHHQEKEEIDYSLLTEIGGLAADKWCRIGTDFFIFNKDFIFDLYDFYKTDKKIWEEVFSKCHSFCADLTLFDVARYKTLGYDGIIIPPVQELKHGCKWEDEMGWR